MELSRWMVTDQDRLQGKVLQRQESRGLQLRVHLVLALVPLLERGKSANPRNGVGLKRRSED
jgi:hypothetical protein